MSDIRKLILPAICILFLFAGGAVAACENPWGGVAAQDQKQRSGVPGPEDVRLCLPPGFIPEAKERGFVFRDPNDGAGARGRLGLAVTPDSQYKHSDSMEDYEKLKAWLCHLSNISEATLCTVTKIQGNLYVLLKGLQVSVHTEAYIRIGNGYMLAITAEAPNDDALAVLKAVIQEAVIP